MTDLFDLTYTGCRSCLACKRKDAERCRCYFNDDLSPVIDRIFSSDALIVGSPIYLGDITSQLQMSSTRCWLYEEIPHDAEADLLVVLGGYQNPAMTKEECDYFDADAQKRLIRKYVDAQKAVIGVCLGAQLVGEAIIISKVHPSKTDAAH